MTLLKKTLQWLGLLLAAALLIFVVLLFVPEREVVPAIQSRETTRIWRMAEGFDIAYTHLKATQSSGQPPLLFLHGGPGGYVHSSIIETLTPLREEGIDLYFYDQRGSGLSDRLPKFSDVTFEDHIEDLHEIITRHIDRGPVNLMGQSHGSTLIATYVARYPETVEKIIFTSPGRISPPLQDADGFVDLSAKYPVPAELAFIEPVAFEEDVNRTELKPKALVGTLGGMLFDVKLVPDSQMDRMLNTLASQFTRGLVCDPANVQPEEGGGGLYAFLSTNNDFDLPDLRAEMGQLVDIPIVVLQGQCDYIPYGVAYEYVDLFPNGRYVFIENAGHEIWWEQPERFLAEIQAFLKE